MPNFPKPGAQLLHQSPEKVGWNIGMLCLFYQTIRHEETLHSNAGSAYSYWSSPNTQHDLSANISPLKARNDCLSLTSLAVDYADYTCCASYISTFCKLLRALLFESHGRRQPRLASPSLTFFASHEICLGVSSFYDQMQKQPDTISEYIRYL